MLAGFQFFSLASMEFDLFLVMIVGFAVGIYFYSILREAHVAYLGILGSIVAVAFCELLSIISLQATAGGGMGLLAEILPLFEYILLPFIAGQLGALLWHYLNRKFDIRKRLSMRKTNS